MVQTEFKILLNEKTKETGNIIAAFLPKEEGHQKQIMEAMNYSFLAGGKRLRPLIMHETYRMLGGQGEEIAPFMAAIEMIHSYSLVHDDLPAMDNDEYRRGRLTTWKVYGEDMAILAGDGLLNYAYETALAAICDWSPDMQIKGCYALSVLARKAGIYGMVGGQTVDVLSEKADAISEEELLYIHENKTAALLEASMMVGAILAGADEDTVSSLELCARKIGLAFQIQDDILDITGTAKELGKPIGSDEKNHKQTYVSLHGLEYAGKRVADLTAEAVQLLDKLPGEKEFLRALLLSLVKRTK